MMPRFLRTIAHVPPSMLWARLRLKCKRTLLARWGRSKPFAWPEGSLATVPEPAVDTPGPVFAPRADCCAKTEDGAYAITLLNETRTFRLPFAWHLPELACGTRLWKLHLHYLEFLEGMGDGDFRAISEDWMRSNRPYHAGYWLDDWNCYALSIRTVVWMQRWPRACAGWSRDFRSAILISVGEQLDFLTANLELDIRGNHIIKNIKALLWGGRFFSGPRGERYYVLGARLLERELAEQILPDGMHFERSPAYHAQVFADLLECFAVAHAPEREILKRYLLSMADALAQSTQPDGNPALFNDGGLEMAYRSEELLAAYARLSLGPAPEPRADLRLESAGYFGKSLADHWVLVDAGRVAPDYLMAHGHGDIFSFEWTYRGRRIVVDPGVYEYNAGTPRDRSRATSSHNTVSLDGQSQCEFWGSFRCGRRADVSLEDLVYTHDGFSLAAQHDGYAWMPGAPIHRREFSFSNGRIDVRDAIAGGRAQIAAAGLLFHPDFRWEAGPGGGVMTGGGLRVRLETDSAIRAEAAEWWSDFGVRAPCVRLVMDYGAAPCAGGFRLSIET